MKCQRCSNERDSYESPGCVSCIEMQNQTNETIAFIYVLLMNHLSPDGISKAMELAKFKLEFLRGEFGFHNTNEAIHKQAIELYNLLWSNT